MKALFLALALMVGIQSFANTASDQNVDYDAQSDSFFAGATDAGNADALMTTTAVAGPSCSDRCSKSESACTCSCFRLNGTAAQRCRTSCSRSYDSCRKCCRH